jgi:radical S-adenosyl methionine domain-containing protein 2
MKRVKHAAAAHLCRHQTPKAEIPPTINLHTLRACNYTCKYCYAGFNDCGSAKLAQFQLHGILRQIADLPRLASGEARKVNFAGGEPFLSKTILEDIRYAKSLGLVTSVVTNGSKLNPQIIQLLAGSLDLLCISVDSADDQTNLQIGRSEKGGVATAQKQLEIIKLAQSLAINIKINTVVSQINHEEDMSWFIRAANPIRWKIFQVSEIKGENDHEFDRWGISDALHSKFVMRHAVLEQDGIKIVPETQEQMRGSYAMVAPNGCFYDNSKGTYIYSRPIIEVGIEEAFSEIAFSIESFKMREGDYQISSVVGASNHD